MRLNEIHFDWARLEWLISPAGVYALLALALLACLALVLSVKREIAQVRRSLKESRKSADASVSTLTTELRTLQAKVERPEETSLDDRESILTGRARALRMQHRGESPATIASALGMPRNEIELLLKIQKLAKAKI